MAFALGKKKSVDMTEGNIFRHLITFAFPLLIGNIFQQLYNMVDTWVVGNYVSNEAFSAVGTVGPIINTLIGIFVGFSSGAGVVISQNFGAKNYDKVKKAVHTSIVVTVILGVILTFAGIAATPFMLKLIKQPDAVKAQSTPYLIIYFAGLMGMLIYNIGSGILRAVGDSQRPFYFLVVSATTNIVLDLVFVFALGDKRAEYGVWAVAFATIIAQAVSAALCIITLIRTDSCIKLTWKELKIDGNSLKKILKVGFPAALQMGITSFSNIFVQSYINTFDTDYMSGWTAYSKIDQLMFLPMQSIALASTTFVGQNLGRGLEKRAKKGITASILMALGTTIVLMIPVIIFAPDLVWFFNKKPEVIETGTIFLRWITPFYVFCCFNQVYAAALRGAGNTKAPMIVMLTSFVAFRQVYLYIMANYISNQPIPIGLSYPAGWILSATLMTIYYSRAKLLKTRVVEEAPEE